MDVRSFITGITFYDSQLSQYTGCKQKITPLRVTKRFRLYNHWDINTQYTINFYDEKLCQLAIFFTSSHSLARSFFKKMDLSKFGKRVKNICI